jgi:hypothetical protein
MRAAGFQMVKLGRGGPGKDADGNPEPSMEDKRRAVELNAEWDLVRRGLPVAKKRVVGEVYPPGSVGDGYQRAMVLREATRLNKGIVWTKEQNSRDDWPRAWKWLGPDFGDCDPKTIVPEHFLSINEKTGEITGLIPRIEAKVSITERHRVMKVWRSLWVKMAAMGYTGGQEDPSLAIPNTAPDPRQAQWQRREVIKRVQMAWRMGYHGLAACIAVAWDSMLSPIDARTLTPAQCSYDGSGVMFLLGRAKTGRAAAATLSPWSQAILTAYVKDLGVELMADVPIFRNRSKVPYSKNKLAEDFRLIRETFDKNDTRHLADMRRSGAVEGDAGGGSVVDQANKMANSVDTNKRLRKTYNPVNVASVRRFDEARIAGAKKLEQKPDESVREPVLLTLFKQAAKGGNR